MQYILIADDNNDITDILSVYVKKEGYEPIIAKDGVMAEDMFFKYEPAAVLLDVMMPFKDGYEVCKSIRQKSAVPIILITARGEDYDKIMGLDIGADDYIKKPFSILELRARVEAHLRREHREKQQVLSTNELKFNLKSKEIYFNDEKILLTKGEYKICEYLARHKGQVFTLEQIFIEVYGFDKDSDSSCIREHIKNIRAKLTKYIESPITTVWGIGYKWI